MSRYDVLELTAPDVREQALLMSAFDSTYRCQQRVTSRFVLNKGMESVTHFIVGEIHVKQVLKPERKKDLWRPVIRWTDEL